MIHLLSVAAVRISPLPVPVHVVDKFLEGSWARWGAIFALFAALFAGFALLVAVKTLRRIDEQIRLANQEIDLVNQDLQNNKRMIEEALRRPDLRPVPTPTISTVPLVVMGLAGHQDEALGIQISAHVANFGERISHSVAIRMADTTLVIVVGLYSITDRTWRELLFFSKHPH